MEIAYIGLGKMGYNMCLNLLDKGYKVTAYNRTFEKAQKLTDKGATAVKSIRELTKHLHLPTVVWIMVPNNAVGDVTAELSRYLPKGSTVIDGGNTYYKDSVKRYKTFTNLGINYLDVGVSGGPSGARNGASLMIGGDKKVYSVNEQLFKDLSVPGGYAYLGNSGSGHFAKMVHNGIEYGMMQSIAEGFDILNSSDFDYDLTQVLKPYSNGSVISSKLVDWLSNAYSKYGQSLEQVSGSAKSSGEGLWASKTAKELGVNTPVLDSSLQVRDASQKTPNYQGKVITALRGEFGEHPIN